MNWIITLVVGGVIGWLARLLGNAQITRRYCAIVLSRQRHPMTIPGKGDREYESSFLGNAGVDCHPWTGHEPFRADK
jgi:hypothetical protein